MTTTAATEFEASKLASSDDANGQRTEQRAGVYSTGFNLANLILGAGALAMPFAFSQSGIMGGVLLIGFTCICGHYTSLLLVKCADFVGVDSYEKLTQKILGIAGYLAFCVLCLIINLGAAVESFIL